MTLRRQIGAKGFTLIELVVTITVAAVLMTLAAPSFVSFQKNSQLTAAANSFLAAATAARAEAMKRQLNAFVRPNSNNDWTTGWNSYVDGDWDTLGTSSVDIQISKSLPLPSTVTVSNDTTPSDATSHNIMFTGAGFMAIAAAAALPAPNSKAAVSFYNGTDTRIVIMEASGRMRVCNPASDTTCSAANTF
jgi:type IV fimbrial biogenesis protein FimT